MEEGRTVGAATAVKNSSHQRGLRNLKASPDFFWQAMREAPGVRPPVHDREFDGNIRPLTPNKYAVMALNELAVHNRRGFFFHFSNRNALKKKPDSEVWPVSRNPALPGAGYPEIAFMDFVWTETARSIFFKTTQRSRFLACNGILNPPTPDVPLYAIQYVTDARYPIYTTEPDSLIVLATPLATFCLATTVLKDLVGGWSPHKRPPTGPDPRARIETMPYLWMDPRERVEWENGLCERLKPHHISNVEDLYAKIVATCSPEHLASTYTSGNLQACLPTAKDPEPGIKLGTLPS